MSYRNNAIMMGDTIYEVDKAYRDGAEAMRRRVPYNVGNPHRYGTYAHDQWNNGHAHEATGEHVRFGSDIITAPRTGRCFEEDPGVPRDEFGVLMTWYANALDSVSKKAA
jgi:hypothetical protein